MRIATSPPDSLATEHGAQLRVSAGGRAEVGGTGSFHWRIFDRTPVVAFLTTSLFGLGPGERLTVRTRLDQDARLVLTGQGPTSLLRTHECCHYLFEAAVGADANLTYLPWAVVPFRGARCVIETDVSLGPGATFIGWDILSTGRVRFGEELALDLLRSTWTVRRDEPLIVERTELRFGDRELIRAMLGASTHLGTLYVVGPADRLPMPSDVHRAVPDGSVAASRVSDELLVVKTLGSSSERVELALWPVVQLARSALGIERLLPQAVARRWLGVRRPTAIA